MNALRLHTPDNTDTWSGDPLKLSAEGRRMLVTINLRKEMLAYIWRLANGLNLSNPDKLVVIHGISDPALLDDPAVSAALMRRKAASVERHSAESANCYRHAAIEFDHAARKLAEIE